MKTRLQEAEIFVKLAKKFPGIDEIDSQYYIHATAHEFDKMVDYAQKKLNTKILRISAPAIDKSYIYFMIL